MEAIYLAPSLLLNSFLIAEKRKKFFERGARHETSKRESELIESRLTEARTTVFTGARPDGDQVLMGLDGSDARTEMT